MITVSVVLFSVGLLAVLYGVFFMKKSELDGVIMTSILAIFVVGIWVVAGGAYFWGSKDKNAEDERTALLAQLEEVHGVSLADMPDDLTEPGTWLVNGKSLTCYVLVHPQPKGGRLYCDESKTYGELPVGK